jgi:predicted amidohydrolase YtcJ
MAYQGEYVEQRYGADVAHHAPPVRAVLRSGVPLGLGTGATIQGSDNLWSVLHWFTTGTTAGGTTLTTPENRLSRVEALRQLTVGSAAMSGQADRKGMLKAGYLADLAVLTDDYFTVPDAAIPDIKSVLTLVGGRPVFAAEEHRQLDPAIPAVVPAYSPIRTGTDRS